ncbi:MAG: sugar-binding domain-containing protein [Planctomycetota bacterium]
MRSSSPYLVNSNVTKMTLFKNWLARLFNQPRTILFSAAWLLVISGIASAQSDGLRNFIQITGPWEARYDAGERGFVEGWHAMPVNSPGWVSVKMPGAVESSEAFAGKDGIFWLRTQFTIPSKLAADRRLRLQFERVVETCKVWLNGEEVGEHAGDAPFFLDITNQAVVGANLLILQLRDSLSGATGEVPRHAGIVGPVSAVDTAAVTIEDLFVKTISTASGEIEITARCESSSPSPVECEVKFEVMADAAPKILASAKITFQLGAGGSAEPKVKLQIPNAAAWSPANPQLYRIAARLLQSGIPLDGALVRSGVRSVDIRGSQLIVNESTLRLRAVIDDGYEPISFISPSPFLDMPRKVQLLKEAGFNTIITRGRQPMKALVDAADKSGIFIIEQLEIPSPEMDWPSAAGLPFYTGLSNYWAGLPFFPRRSNRETPASVEILNQQIKRDRSAPSVLWYGIADARGSFVKILRELDGDNIFSRDGKTSGRNYYYSPTSLARRYYLRPEFDITQPFDDATRLRILELGDRDDFTIATIHPPAAASDWSRGIAGLGGDTWTEDARAFSASLAKLTLTMQPASPRYFKDSAELIEQAQSLHAETSRRAMETLRANRRIAVAAVGYVHDSPGRLGRGLFDIFGRPKAAHAQLAKANVLRRAVLFPARRAGEAPQAGMPATSLDLEVSALSDESASFDIIAVEVATPDKLNGVSVPKIQTRYQGINRTSMGCTRGVGTYTANPIWKDLKDPWLEEVKIQGILVQKSYLTLNETVARPAPHVAIFGTPSDLWNEEEFIKFIDLMETAKAGGTVIIAKSLSPVFAPVALGLFPNLQIIGSRGALHAGAGDYAFEGLPGKGILRDPFNEIVPLYTIRPFGDANDPAKSSSIALDEDGGMLGYSLLQIPFGAGKVIVTTFPLSEFYFYDVAPRKILANLVDEALKTPAPAGPIPDKAPDRETWRKRFRESAMAPER